MSINMKEIETAKFVDKQLRTLGYQAKMIDEITVGSTASGLNFYIQSCGNSIQFRSALVLDNKKTDNWLDFVNAFNKIARFVKVYAYDERIYIEADWWLDLDGEERVKCFQDGVEMWEILLSELKQKLREYFTITST